MTYDFTAYKVAFQEGSSSTKFDNFVQAVQDGFNSFVAKGDLILNVKDYGAKGDGITNDTSAIQAAINAANVVAGVVFFPAGSYSVTTLIMLPFVTLRGVGFQAYDLAHSSIIKGTVGSDVISLPNGVTNYSNMAFENLIFSGGNSQIVSTNLATYVFIDRCFFTGASQAAIRVRSGAIEEWYLRDVSCSGGQWFYKQDNVVGVNSTPSYFDKTVFDRVLTTGQSDSAYYIETPISNTVTWINPIIQTAAHHGFYADGGIRSWKFINTNTEGNGQTGKHQRTTGSITSGTPTLTVTSATGFTNGDPIVVTGAGTNGADLITTVTTIVGTTFTLAANAATTVSGAQVSNGSYDDFNFNSTIATPSLIEFMGGMIGGEGTNGKLRYAIYSKAERLTLIGVGGPSALVPVYDNQASAIVVGGSIVVRAQNSVVGDPFNALLLPASGDATVRTQIPSPNGKDILLVLRDNLGNGTGTFGTLSVRRYDTNRTLAFQVPAKGPVFAQDSFTLKEVAGAVSDVSFDSGYANDGTIAIDVSNERLYFKVNGVWKYLSINLLSTGNVWTKSQTFSNALVQARVTPVYGVTVNVDASQGNEFDITVTDANAFTIANPTNLTDGQVVTYTIRNTTAGAIGAATWGTTFKLAAWTQPGAANSRSITFKYNGANLVEISRTPADVPN